MASVLTVRTALASLLSGDLGTYTLPNGATTPAIGVRDYGVSLPAGTTVAGIEVLIISEPQQQDPLAMYRSGAAFDWWTIFLVDWSGSSAPRLQALAAKIHNAYPGARMLPITAPRGVGPRSQMRIDIRTDPEPVA